MIKKYYVALRPCEFDKRYVAGDEISPDVIFPSRVAALIDEGVIQEGSVAEKIESTEQFEKMLLEFEERILTKVDERITALLKRDDDFVVLDTDEDVVPNSDTAAEGTSKSSKKKS